MPLDITLFRKEGGNPELIRESQRRRYASVELIDEIIAKDDNWRALTGQADNLRKARNTVQKDIATHKKALATAAKDPSVNVEEHTKQCDFFLAQKTELDNKINDTEILQAKLKVEIDSMVGKVGNIVLDSVPVGNDEDTGNRVERRWGNCR
jgi:seryl-tRNA synthetase